jgi:hypothetical protein
MPTFTIITQVSRLAAALQHPLDVSTYSLSLTSPGKPPSNAISKEHFFQGASAVKHFGSDSGSWVAVRENLAIDFGDSFPVGCLYGGGYLHDSGGLHLQFHI